MDMLQTRIYVVPPMNEKHPTYSQPSLRFYNAATQSIIDSIWNLLQNGLWREYQIDNRLYNDELGEMRIGEWEPIFPNIHPIYPGYDWDISSNQLVEHRFVPQHIENVNLNTFLDVAHQYFLQFQGKKIGVHLSGGLDSSLIICLLHYFHIPFVLGGITTTRYEFRTEHRIQQVLSEYGDDVFLIDAEEYSFYSGLLDMPKHQIPDSYIKSNVSSRKLAQEFAARGVNVVMSGQGADTLFVDAVPKTGANSYNIGNEFDIPFEHDLIYAPYGVDLQSFYAYPPLIEQIHNLRRGQREDAYKIWARQFFKEFLPRELSEFHYCADFFGLSMSGLEQAKPDIAKLFEEARTLLPHPIFSEENTKTLLNTNVFNFDYKAYCAFCVQVSIAAWLHALLRKD